jgi:hypothetical protein
VELPSSVEYAGDGFANPSLARPARLANPTLARVWVPSGPCTISSEPREKATAEENAVAWDLTRNVLMVLGGTRLASVASHDPLSPRAQRQCRRAHLWQLSHPERQCLPKPPQGLDGAIQGHRVEILGQLPRLASRQGPRRRALHAAALPCWRKWNVASTANRATSIKFYCKR